MAAKLTFVPIGSHGGMQASSVSDAHVALAKTPSNITYLHVDCYAGLLVLPPSDSHPNSSAWSLIAGVHAA